MGDATLVDAREQRELEREDGRLNRRCSHGLIFPIQVLAFAPSTVALLRQHSQSPVQIRRPRLSFVTIHMRVERILRMEDPRSRTEAGMAAVIELDLKDQAEPRSKAHKTVDSARLRAVGLDLRAGRTLDWPDRPPANTALQERSHGRLADREAWWIVLEASETKGTRPDKRPISGELTPCIDRWCGLFLAPFTAFWASTKGGNLAYTYVGTTVADISLRELGVAINPHAFRDCLVCSSPSAPRDGHRLGRPPARPSGDHREILQRGTHDRGGKGAPRHHVLRGMTQSATHTQPAPLDRAG